MNPSGHRHSAAPVRDPPPFQRAWVGFRRRVVPTLRIVVAGAILVTLVSWSGPDDVLALLVSFPLSTALSCVLLALLVQVLAAIRLSLLAHTQRLPLSTGDALGINLSAVFYGLFLPGGNATGWAVRVFRLSAGPTGVATAMLVLAGDRALATATGAGIGAIADILLDRPATLSISVLLIAVAAAASGLVWALLLSDIDKLFAKARKWLGFGWLMSKARDRGHTPLFPEPVKVLYGLGLALLVHALGITIWVWLARSLDLGLDALTITWVRSVALVVGLVPVTIGGLGVREGVVVYLLTRLGVTGADALALSLLAFAVTVLAIGFVGGVAEAIRLLIRRPGSEDRDAA